MSNPSREPAPQALELVDVSGCGNYALLRPDPRVAVYCLHMDSGAAWHIDRTGDTLGRCPSDGCRLGH